jgi:hypothetical protein
LPHRDQAKSRQRSPPPHLFRRCQTDRIDRALRAVNLIDRAGDACDALSKGLRQRVARLLTTTSTGPVASGNARMSAVTSSKVIASAAALARARRVDWSADRHTSTPTARPSGTSRASMTSTAADRSRDRTTRSRPVRPSSTSSRAHATNVPRQVVSRKLAQLRPKSRP